MVPYWHKDIFCGGDNSGHQQQPLHPTDCTHSNCASILYQAPERLTHGRAHIVMPAEAGIHGFAACINGKSWMPTFVGMTGNGEPRVNLSAGWY
jgi:hypothetical protein